MPKQKITIHLDSEIAEKLRLQSIDKYHNSRSMSRLIEDLATGAVEAKKPEACSRLGHRSEDSLSFEAEFNRVVAETGRQLDQIKVFRVVSEKNDFPIHNPSELYFTFKEACELKLNEYAKLANECWSCDGLSGPLSTFPDAGRNFEIYATMKKELR